MTLPLTILGGYLGAGKTTLVNRMLRNAGGRRLAILVNDFGDLAVDADLIEAEEDDLISLAGGCVCCSYGDDLMAALIQMTRMTPPPDAIVLEASGVAMPATVGGAVSLMSGITLAGIVVLADADRLPRLLSDRYLSDTITRQLDAADLIVITKTDLADTARSETLLALHAPGRPVAHGPDVTTDMLLAQHARRDTRFTQDGHSARHLTRLLPDQATQDITALGRTLADDPVIVRAKGALETPDGIRMLQVVGGRFTLEQAPEDAILGVVVISLPEVAAETA